jgi:hypothetical protein
MSTLPRTGLILVNYHHTPPTIPSNNDENFPPAISFVILQKLSLSVAIPSSPSKAAALPSPEVSMSTAELTFNGKTMNDNNNNNEKPINVQPVGKWFRDNDFILFIFILLFISNHILTYYHPLTDRNSY